HVVQVVGGGQEDDLVHAEIGVPRDRVLDRLPGGVEHRGSGDVRGSEPVEVVQVRPRPASASPTATWASATSLGAPGRPASRHADLAAPKPGAVRAGGSAPLISPSPQRTMRPSAPGE